MEQSFEWSTGFSPFGVNHFRRSANKRKSKRVKTRQTAAIASKRVKTRRNASKRN
jgi:hypothetical protein